MTASAGWDTSFPGVSTARVRYIDAWKGAASVVVISGPTTIAGKKLVPRGDSDIVVVSHRADGSPAAVLQLGGTGDDDIADVTDDGRQLWVAIKSSAPLEVAGKTFQPPAREPDSLLAPTVAIAIAIDHPLEAVRAEPLPTAESFAIEPARAGGLLIAAGRIGDESLFGRTTLELRDSAGVKVWSEEWASGEPAELVRDPESHTVAFALRRDKSLDVFRVRAATGDIVTRAQVEKLPSAGDLGSIGGLVAVRDGVLAGGATGGAVRVDGRDHQRPSYAVQPFVLTAGPGGGAFADVADVTGHVVGGGRVGDTPAMVLRVIHTGGDASLHRGVYVRLGDTGDGAQLVPVYQYRYENDDWENQPGQHVLGTEIYPHSADFHGDDLYLAGHADSAGDASRVMMVKLRRRSQGNGAR